MRGWLGRSALLALTLALACGDDDGAGRDAGVDGGVDGGRDAGGDAGMDASVDGGECSSRPDAAPPDLPDTGPLAPAPELDCGTPSFPEGTGQGNVHFVSIDTNDATLIPIAIDIRDTVTDDMLDWLADDLAASDAEWKIVFFHHPPYTSSSRDPNGVVRQQVVPLLEAGGVDLVLAGHDHHYERTLPMQGGCVAQPDDTGITYIIAGAGGAGLRGDVTPRFWHAASDDTVHSYVRLTIHGCVARGEAVSAEGEVLDTFELGGC